MFWEVSLKYEHCPEGRGFLHVSVFCGFSGGDEGIRTLETVARLLP